MAAVADAMGDSPPMNAPAVPLALFAALAACTTAPRPAHPRPALLPPAELLAPYALPGPVALTSLERGPITRHSTRLTGTLDAGWERTCFELVLPTAAAPAPFVLLLPILAGGEELMTIVADGLADRGFAVGWNRRAGSALRPPQRGPDLEELFRRTVVHNRMLLAWARRSPLVDGRATAALGLSMGGMVGAVLMAAEPDLGAAALCLGGADLATVTVRSAEPRVIRWRQWRAEADGAGPWQIGAELGDSLRSDPRHLAPYVATERILLVAATLDQVVPWPNQQLLWEAFGRPQRLCLPLGHYTAALALNPILDAAAAFFATRQKAV